MDLKQALIQQPLFAFNLDDFTIFKAVSSALAEKKAPAIFQLSPGEADFWGLENFVNLLKPHQSKGLFLNIDHGKDLNLLEKAIGLGFDLIHFDGSSLPWEENIGQTAKIVEMAHAKGVLVEGEPEPENTDPQKVAEFVSKTKVDLIAVFCGNKHGLDPANPENLDLERLRKIKKAVGETLLALHGGSGVPLEQIKQVMNERLVAKININSLLRNTYFQALKEQLAQYQGKKVYELLKPVSEKISQKVIELLE
ncbi:class II fructose-bisphosphate aldolase [Candidatus Shapirobacteria bacterium]|nr:class II fructose-bisphosphate aldolase [Candidatus Shapirobacteria bacterium]